MAEILVVDDDLVSTLYIEQILKSLGHSIIEKAKSGPEGVEKAKRYKPEIVLMDISMPGEYDGIEAARIIEKELNIPIIFITAYEIDQFLNRVQEVGPFGYILKPFKEVEVKASIYIAQYRKKMEERIRQIEKDRLLIEKIDLRKERFVTIGQLSSAIIHEINQPLQSIKVLSESAIKLEKEERDLSKEELIDYYKKILERTSKVEEIINNLRTLIKTPDDISSKPENINLLLNDLKSLLKDSTDSYNIGLIYELGENLKNAYVEKILFQQIVTNVVDNAINILKEIDKENKKIIIRTSEESDYILLQIMDNGPGVKDDIKNKIFDPFFSENNDKAGMGLGLYIVYNIIKTFGGSIEVNDNEFNGTTFSIRFIKASD